LDRAFASAALLFSLFVCPRQVHDFTIDVTVPEQVNSQNDGLDWWHGLTWYFLEDLIFTILFSIDPCKLNDGKNKAPLFVGFISANIS
jgi:hypothetical protein